MLPGTKTFLLFLLMLLFTSCNPRSNPALPSMGAPTMAVETAQPSLPSPTLPPPAATGTSLPRLPTDTPLPPTSTSTPAPTSLNPVGPYVAFFAHSGIWISNPVGTFATQLTDYEITAALDLHRLISPTREKLALVASNDLGLDLVIISIPGGEAEIVTHLIDRPPAENYDPTSANSFATYAIRDYDSIAWQPGEGRLLAFIGAMDGPTADLYVYDTQTKVINRLTDGPSQAVLPIWSPDGQYILQYGVRWVPPFGGAIGNANQLDGVWAVRAMDGEVITLPKPKGIIPNFVGWQDDSHYITYDSGECYSENLRSISVPGGTSTPILDNSFWYNIALAPENGALLFSSTAECASSLGEGVYLLMPGAEPAQLIDKRAWEISWMPESNVFDAYPEALFSSDGQVRYDPPVYESSFDPAISRLGYQAWNVIQNRLGHVMVRISNEEWKTILTGNVRELIWDPVHGDTLLVAMDDGAVYAAAYPDFSPHQVADLGGGIYGVIWTP